MVPGSESTASALPETPSPDVAEPVRSNPTADSPVVADSNSDSALEKSAASLPDTGSFVPLTLPGGSSASRSPRLAGSETVINREGARAILPPQDFDSHSGQMMQRLFPPMQESGSSIGSFSPRGIELDHFRIEERIGMGGMGAVFRAVDTRLQRHVALKLLAPSQSHDEGAVKRFQNEARAAARLDHEHVARVYYIGEERGLNFIAFEFVTGSTIRELIRQLGRVSVADSINYVLQIATALKHTSAMGVVHRDIKPSNIIITPNGRAKLVDLGLARNDTTESQGELTLPGTTLGTFDYISPEQAKDPRSVDIRSDIYSLGCTLYHMLTGQPPYPEGTVLQKLLDHQGGEAPDPAEINRRVPEFVSVMVRRMMNSDRNKRYQNADQLIRDLTHAAGVLGLRGVNPEGLVWVSSNSVEPGRLASHAGWITTVALLLGVAGALQVYNNWERRLPGLSEETDRAVADVSPSSQNGVDSAPPPGARIASAGATGTPAEISPASPKVGPEANGEPLTLIGNGESALAHLESSPGEPFIGPEAVLAPDIKPIPRMTELITGDSTADDGSAAGSPAESETTSTGGGTVSVPESVTPVPDAIGAAEMQLPVALFTGDASLDRHYRTLEAACAAAEDGSTIELQFSGRLVEKSFRIMKKNLTIRAARDHHPVIEFVPSEIDSTDADARMITIQNGPLRLVNVHLQMTVPARPTADRYALFGLSRPGLLTMDGVVVTVDNPSLAPAAIIDITAEFGRMPTDMPTAPVAVHQEELGVQVTDCLFRGNTNFADIAWPGQLSCTVENCGAALQGDFFQIRPLIMPSVDRPVLSLNVEHITTRLDGSFVRLTGPVSVDAPSIECVARNSIFSLVEGTPFVTSGPGIAPEDARRMLVWRGQRNFFDESSVLWAIESSDNQLDWNQWRDLWQLDGSVGEQNEAVDWIVDPVTITAESLDQLKPRTFSLAPGVVELNPAIQGATDGSDAGVNVFRLPLTVISAEDAGPLLPATKDSNSDSSAPQPEAKGPSPQPSSSSDETSKASAAVNSDPTEGAPSSSGLN